MDNLDIQLHKVSNIGIYGGYLMNKKCVTDCNHCIRCEMTKIKNHGNSICYDKYGYINCGYYNICSYKSDDVYACKLYFKKERI